VRKDLGAVARTSYETVLEPGREAVAEKYQFGGRTEDERWAAVQKWLASDPEELRDWRKVAAALAALRDDPPSADPVQELADFLSRDTFRIDLKELELAVPDSVGVFPELGSTLEIYHPATTGDKKKPYTPALIFKLKDRSDYDSDLNGYRYRCVLIGEPVVLRYHPGEELSASLPLSDRQLFTWVRGSTRYQFDRLSRPPYLHKEKQEPSAGTLFEGVQLRVVQPPRGLPMVPDLLPTTRR
jgi:hypothetical protein